MNFTDPTFRQASRAVLHVILVLSFLALLFWLTYLLQGHARELYGIARGMIIILGIVELLYGSENITRAFKFSGPAGFGADFGAAGAPEAAQKVADTAQQTADVIKEQANDPPA